jgi:hypothetical protein
VRYLAEVDLAGGVCLLEQAGQDVGGFLQTRVVAKMLPRATSKSTPRSTRSSLYDFSRPRTWIAGPRTRLVVGRMLMTASMEG